MEYSILTLTFCLSVVTICAQGPGVKRRKKGNNIFVAAGNKNSFEFTKNKVQKKPGLKNSGSNGGLNDRCTTIKDCQSFGYLCAKNFTCQCLGPIYVLNKNRDKCVGAVDQRCKYDEHCIDGAFCQSQTKCKCKDYFYPNEDGTECSNSCTIVPRGYLILPLILLCYLKLYL